MQCVVRASRRLTDCCRYGFGLALGGYCNTMGDILLLVHRVGTMVLLLTSSICWTRWESDLYTDDIHSLKYVCLLHT